MKRNNSDLDLTIRIIQLLQKEDRPLIAHHIAKGLKETSQLVDYHLKRMVEQGIILVDESTGSKYYVLQPPFYIETAESALLELMLPWAKEFSKQCIVLDEEQRSKVALNSIRAFFLNLLSNLESDSKTSL